MYLAVIGLKSEELRICWGVRLVHPEHVTPPPPERTHLSDPHLDHAPEEGHIFLLANGSSDCSKRNKLFPGPERRVITKTTL
ncbi:hypothetical protein F7725_004069 [Dissostichus mawsoni]|uniref:Uncharacterized protein n=1 Tax=Dissostichus mawsoni TaxID=36200 RepID=A0A7J5YDB4_DISMA|nr:hypothetical protein F7725_004069 [Dissostichus mawsoni]